MIMGCARAPIAKFGASQGKRDDKQLQDLISGLETFSEVGSNAVGPPKRLPPGTADMLRQYFGTAYNGDLVDLIYFVDARPGLQGAVVRVGLTRGDERPTILEDEQNVWALVFVAVKDAEACGFVADLLHETIAPTPSPSETGLVKALLGLAKISAEPEGTEKPKDAKTTFAVPDDACPKKPEAEKPSKEQAEKSEEKKPDEEKKKDEKKKDEEDSKDGPVPFALLGKTNGVSLYARATKLVVTSGTTHRVVLTPRVDKKSTIEFPIRGLTVTFRNASRPAFRASVGLGARIDVKERETTNGMTETGRPLDPDLYVLAHLLLGHSDFQLQTEWYPSFFIGTNLVTRSPLNDLVVGFRMPIVPGYKLGIGAGLNWAKLEYKEGEMTRSKRRTGLFFAIDYDF